MKPWTTLIILVLILFVSGSSFAATAVSPPVDPGWPRVIEKNGNELTIYQPQVDFWNDYKDLGFRCAISVKTAAAKEEKFGIADVEADTETDHEKRTVVLLPKKRALRFPNISEAEANALRRIVEELHPQIQAMTISLDRILPYLEPAQQTQQHAVELNLDPPKIFYSPEPAILVIFQGEPQLQPVVKEKNDLMFAVNTNWDVFYDSLEQKYYLLNGDNWLTTTDAVKGTLAPAATLPTGFSSLPEDDNWSDVRQQVPGRRETSPPVVLVTTEPAELILTEGEPNYSPIPSTKLLRVANTDSPVFLNTGDNNHYLLTAGRWFRAASLKGPWTAASANLPEEFARIPDDDPAAFVKASVPGTTEAKDAVLLASVPSTTTVELSNSTVVEVTYTGEPQFEAIPSTTVQYAVNSPKTVFLVDGNYYCCDQGVWFSSAGANGPWAYSTSVPSAIYTIPSSHPLHNVTYVVVENTTPTTVIYSQTAGYSGEYVASTGVLMFGAGMVAGAMIVNHHDYYYPWYSAHYSYGCGARYNYAYGGYYRSAHVSYGPYGGAGAGAAYNPRTGTYSRGAYAYGPAGSASVRQAYNPYTGTRAQSGRVNTAYGSAGRGAAYNPNTGTAVRGGYRSSAYGSAAGVQTNRGSGAVAWDTNQGQGAVAKDRQGNVYAGKDGNVYKKGDAAGSWSTNTGSGWQTTGNRQATHDLQTQSQARNRGNQLSQSSRSVSRSNYGGGGRRGGGRR
ncbi:MAG: hypothetical protein KKD01_04345 [Proteobacteria bacterium]|nr:hypothetical protein [Pseudomonadota bacterium]MBU1419084.1 hypothetical protein [Pseudomonadota bacterium]MBU1453937.1 hypothetical protein [Pseudomonadota bacterium]